MKSLQYYLTVAILSVGGFINSTNGQDVTSVAYDGLVQLNQGWSREEVDLYNHTTEGTNLAPVDFFLSLPDPDNVTERFLSRLTAKYGFISSSRSKANPSGLPVGLAIDERPKDFGDRPYIGITCSACHTRQMTYRSLDEKVGEKIWNLSVHGGPALVDILRFKTELYTTFLRLSEDQGLFETFAKNLLGREPTHEESVAIKQELADFLGPVVTMRGIIKAAGIKVTESGPGNLNALTQGYYNNLGLFGWLMKKGLEPPNPSPIPIPMPAFEGADNYPPVWFAWSDNWAQWFVEIHHPGPRNWVQAISSSEVRPPKMIDSLKKKAVFETIHFDNISAIQTAIERLSSPLKKSGFALPYVDQRNRHGGVQDGPWSTQVRSATRPVHHRGGSAPFGWTCILRETQSTARRGGFR